MSGHINRVVVGKLAGVQQCKKHDKAKKLVHLPFSQQASAFQKKQFGIRQLSSVLETASFVALPKQGPICRRETMHPMEAIGTKTSRTNL